MRTTTSTRTRAALTALLAVVALSLSACGGDDDGGDEARRRPEGRPTCASGSTAPTRPRRPATGSRRSSRPRTTARRSPSRSSSGRAWSSGSPLAVQRVRDPRRRRGRQHPGRHVHRRRAPSPTSPTRSTRWAATTCCRASSRPAASTARPTRCPTTPARSTSSTARTCSRRPASRCRPRWTSSSQAAIEAQGGQPRAGELLRLLVPRPGLAQRRHVPLGRRRRPRRRGRRRVAGRAVRPPSRRPGWRPCRP